MLEQRLMKFTRKQESGCWLWVGCVNSRGYGTIKVAGKMLRAHRLAYEVFIGPIPDGMMVCHSCDNPSCVNPAHLWAGTNKENQEDSVNKGRKNPPVNESHGNCKLSNSDLIEIRNLRDGGATQKSIAAKFGVRDSQISRVLSGKSRSTLT